MPELRATDLYKPTGDQPMAIDEIAAGINAGERFQILLGATAFARTRPCE
jgi:excinuclease ABC subunit B